MRGNEIQPTPIMTNDRVVSFAICNLDNILFKANIRRIIRKND